MTEGQNYQLADGNLSFSQIGELLSAIWNEGFPQINMYPANEKTDDVTYPNIVWSCAGKWPTNALKPRLMDEFSAGDGKSYSKKIMVFRSIMRLTVTARSPRQANQIIDELEDFVFEYIGALKKAGAAEVIYAERREDKQGEVDGTVTRTLDLEIREQKSIVSRQNVIESIETRIRAVVNSPEEITDEIVSTVK